MAIVVVKPGQTLTTDDRSTFVAKKLARFKCPRRYLFVDELPKNSMGKILHYQVREQFRDL